MKRGSSKVFYNLCPVKAVHDKTKGFKTSREPLIHDPSLELRGSDDPISNPMHHVALSTTVGQSLIA